MPRLVTLEERAAIIRAALREATVVVLQDLLGDLRDRVVVAVTFLAMLELVKGREVEDRAQAEPFGPIVCRSRRVASSGSRLVPVGPGRELEDEAALPDGEPPATAGPDQAGDHEVEPDGLGTASAADIEALLFVAERPLTRAELRSPDAPLGRGGRRAAGRPGDADPRAGHPPRLVGRAGDAGHLAGSGALIARYLGADAVRLSPAALETLAIVAYRQPVTRGVIERIRGVDSGHVVRGLLHRRLIHEQGRAESPGRPILFATSMEFMERFGLTSLDDLPPLEADIAARLAQAEADAAEGLLSEPGAGVTGVAAMGGGLSPAEAMPSDDGEPLAEDG